MGPRPHPEDRRLRAVELDVPGLDFDGAPPPHRIACIHDEVEEYLLQVARVRFDHVKGRCQLGAHGDTLPDEPLEHGPHLGDHRVQIERARLARPRATEGKKLLVRAAARSPAADIRIQLVAYRFRSIRQALGKQAGADRDDREEVVEVVRDAAGELPHGVHLLDVAELLLEPSLLGHVIRDGQDRHLAVEEDWEPCDFGIRRTRRPSGGAFSGHARALASVTAGSTRPSPERLRHVLSSLRPRFAAKRAPRASSRRVGT